MGKLDYRTLRENVADEIRMKIFREVKGLPEPEEKKEGEGIPDTEHLKSGGIPPFFRVRP